MEQEALKKFINNLGLNYIGDDFDLHLKKVHHIIDFEIGHISVSPSGNTLEVGLYEPDKGKKYLITFNSWCLVCPADYNELDRDNMKNLSSKQLLLKSRLRVQSALLQLYNEKDAMKKNYVGRPLINIVIAINGKLLWR